MVVLSQRPEGNGRFLENGRDDSATVATLSELLAAAGRGGPELEGMRGWVEEFRARVERGHLLAGREQMLVAAALMEIESHWGFGSAGMRDGRM